MMSSIFFIQLLRLAINRFRSHDDYFMLQKHQAVGVLADINKIFNLSGVFTVIDYGCGDSGFSYVLAENFEKVFAVDYVLDFETDLNNLHYISADLMQFKAINKVDFIFCSSVIEHIADQEIFILNLSNNLKVNGLLYLSFPPFFSIVGGHQLKPFHFLPEKVAISIGKLLRIIDKNVTSYANLEKNGGLYKTKTKAVCKLLEESGYEIIKVKPRYFNDKSILSRITLLPLFGDFLTWHAEIYAIRRQDC